MTRPSTRFPVPPSSVVLLVIILAYGAGARADPAQAYTPPPYSAADLRAEASLMRQAGDGFRAAARANHLASQAWLRRVFAAAKDACDETEALSKWWDALYSSGFGDAGLAIDTCMHQHHAPTGEGCWLDLGKDEWGCGAPSAPQDCYPRWADDADAAAKVLDDYADCLSAARTAADAAARQAALKAQQEEEKKREEQQEQQEAQRKQQEAEARAQKEAQQKRAEAAQQKAAQQREAAQQAREKAEKAEAERKKQIADRYQQEQADAAAESTAQDQEIHDLADLLFSLIDMRHTNQAHRPWLYYRFELGLGVNFFPILEDVQGADVHSYSNGADAGGMGVLVSQELWPYYGPFFGIGGFGRMAFGVTPAAGGGSEGWDLTYGARAAMGPQSMFALLLEVSWGIRSGSVGQDLGAGIIDAHGTGDAKYHYARYGVGGQVCLSGGGSRDPGYCESGLDVSFLLDSPAPDATIQIPGVAASYWMRGGLVLSAEAFFNYPAGGTSSYPLDGGTQGTVFLVDLSYDGDL